MAVFHYLNADEIEDMFFDVEWKYALANSLAEKLLKDEKFYQACKRLYKEKHITPFYIIEAMVEHKSEDYWEGLEFAKQLKDREERKRAEISKLFEESE